ncbi:hypothetical protein [Natrinema soli]|uniref:Cardiolipin synthase N-terminal domain-containing protein n=1 Tax=Natrinema soli TaxID=1930624 RepID=A0ABD5STG4_9EURY|nr:hypothetical protein [Natrinema soli]
MLQFALLPLQAGGEAADLDPTTILIATVIGLIIGLLIAAGAGYWVYKDASKRENNELMWAIGIAALLFLFFPVGIVALIVYVVLRGEKTDSEPMASEATGGEW